MNNSKIALINQFGKNNVEQVGSKQFYEVTHKNIKLLFSYFTCVAYQDKNKFMVTSHKFSVTTSKQLSCYFKGIENYRIPTDDLERELILLGVDVKNIKIE